MIQMDGGDRLRVTLLDRMSTVETSRSCLTLEAILMADKNRTSPQILSPPPSRSQSNRSLLEVMQREHRHDQSPRDRTAWKSLREKLRLKRNGSVWISSNSIPSLDTPIPNRDNVSHQLGFLLSNSNITEEASSVEGRVRLGAVLAEERALSAREEETPAEREVEPARMSLMELLEENEGQMSLVSVDGEAEEEVAVTAAEISCCVCMVRSKGAAFIPCGHTFCRLCSRELWVQRGNCPLCNTTILEVLDLF
ncbi:Zinc finger RING-type [Arabidopsis thaliana x Arabidopsis arenosa]|uniref:Zinc finger RING-type n=1 Tax=Arabidopsis thaliana x Arabidopsis arenosa TaxID=1240361 RepID=A0A8T2AYE6_9BRAS|nr:Zinc finger RING-type [Arabidopsis thaliana x Arabidopsis arenosa]